jgi:hypothetical protein
MRNKVGQTRDPFSPIYGHKKERFSFGGPFFILLFSLLVSRSVFNCYLMGRYGYIGKKKEKKKFGIK